MKNIIFIGMPGSGKSTLGVVLAKKLGYSFIDSDLVIQEKYGTTLERIIEKYGDDGFIKIENDVNCTISFRQVPTDGSVATTQFSLLTNKIALPPYEQEKVKYEFKINCILDDQLSNTTSDDYFGATLSIYLFINAASSI